MFDAFPMDFNTERDRVKTLAVAIELQAMAHAMTEAYAYNAVVLNESDMGAWRDQILTIQKDIKLRLNAIKVHIGKSIREQHEQLESVWIKSLVARMQDTEHHLQQFEDNAIPFSRCRDTSRRNK